MIPSEKAHVIVAAISDAGMSGKNNEDRYSVSAFQLETNPPTPTLLAVVADGIGGHNAGEVASEMAVELINRYIAESDGSQPVAILNGAITQAGRAIHDAAESNPELRGMGSTCACVWIIGNRLYMATVGDSRVYLLRDDSIQQLSKDHTWVQEALDNGTISPKQANNHPNAHVIRRYLGSRQTVVPDFRIRLSKDENDTQAVENQGMTLLPGDRILLCSDGLTDLVSDEEIRTYIANKKGKLALNNLVDLANQRGGHDNITMIHISVPEPSKKQNSPAPPSRQKKRTKTLCLVASILLVAALLIGGGVIWYSSNLTTNVDPTATLSFDKISTLPSVMTAEATQPSFAPLPEMPTALPPTSVEPTMATPQQISPPLQFTLTPWPTNTSAPYP